MNAIGVIKLDAELCPKAEEKLAVIVAELVRQGVCFTARVSGIARTSDSVGYDIELSGGF
jgi:hypothetical protein